MGNQPVFDNSQETEVSQFEEMLLRVENDIARSDIAMHDAVGMGNSNRIADLAHDALCVCQ